METSLAALAEAVILCHDLLLGFPDEGKLIRVLQDSSLGYAEGEDFMVNVKGVHEEHKRSALKTVSWRAIATSTTVILVYIFTGEFELAAGVGIGDVLLKVMFYFLHERAWNRIAFGRSLAGTIESTMRAPPVTAVSSDAVLSVIQKMVGSDIGAVIVEDRKEPVGLITEKDILERALQTGKDPSKTLAEDIMSSPVATVEYGTSLTEMLKMMREKKIRRLAVTGDGKLVGIVTERRILDALI